MTDARPISLRLDADLLAALDAAVDGGDRSAWIKGAIRMRLARPGGGVGHDLPTLPPLGGRKVQPRRRAAPPLQARSISDAFARRRR